jgi:hypothetical protein
MVMPQQWACIFSSIEATAKLGTNCAYPLFSSNRQSFALNLAGHKQNMHHQESYLIRLPASVSINMLSLEFYYGLTF